MSLTSKIREYVKAIGSGVFNAAKNYTDDQIRTMSESAITIDADLSSSSENPVQNKIIKNALDSKADNSSIPTKISDLTDDSNFLKQSDLPNIPTKTSELTNDAGFLTQHQDISTLQGKNLSTPLSINGVMVNTVEGALNALLLSIAIQYSVMPQASSANAGRIIQYIGETNNNYTNGYFYKNILENNTYFWQQVNVQPGTQAESLSRDKNTFVDAEGNILLDSNNKQFIVVSQYNTSE